LILRGFFGLFLFGALTGTGASGQDAHGSAYRGTVVPFLAAHCVSCHGNQAKAGGLSLVDPGASGAIWDKVLDKLSTGRMPPLGAPQPSKGEVSKIAAWIDGMPGRTRIAGEPGRVTSRRLNRAEYNNTVRDLLGVSLRPADEFPLDDAGYGFDTVGDVLSVSPMLMEKYIAAARRLSRVAVYGETTAAKPTKLIRYMTKKSQDDPTPNALPFSNRGAIYGSFQFPVSGEYEFRMRVGNYRPRQRGTARQRELSLKRGLSEVEKAELNDENRKAYPPVRMVMTLDGAQILTEVVEGNIDFQYAHGESIARVTVRAGEHFFRASFPEFADLENPLDNMNLDGRRKLFIDYVDIVGPFQTAVEKPQSYGRLFVCAERTAACAERILGGVARRAYRRPVTKEELGALTGLAAMVRRAGDPFDESIRVGLQAVLLSPHFLFRAEPMSAGVEMVSEHDLASRLSYFLWASMPDAELLGAADRGTLRKPGVLDAQVRRMLSDPKSDALVENFAGQWLGLRLMERRKPDPGKFPRVDDELLEAMRRETILFTRAILREDRSVLDFLDGRFSFVNGPLARHYGIAGITGEELQRVALEGGRRGGVVTQGSVLTLSSYATRTSPVLRGRWVLENLLGTPPPPPPPDIPALEEANVGTTASLRTRLEQHRANAGCAVCHDQMDPIGFGLENFDAGGAWRDRDGQFPVDATGTFPGGAPFRGPEELRLALAAQPGLFVRNLTEKLMTYALGRGLEAADRPAVDAITGRLAANGFRMTSLVHEIVNSQPFQMRGKNAAK
jgi:hypothetical protein